MIKFESAAHWYTKDLKPQHDADLRVARKELLYPSVTTIDKDVVKNIALERYKLIELAKAAASTFKQAHEDDESYAKRIYELSLEYTNKAAEFGSKIHSAAEHWPKEPKHPEVKPWFDKLGEWISSEVSEVLATEQVIVDHTLGVAGKCDSIVRMRDDGRVAFLDYKTQGIKPKKSGKKAPLIYPSWGRQLAFYSTSHAKSAPDALGIGVEQAQYRCISVIIDSTEASPPYIHEWKREEILGSYKEFVVAAWWWFNDRNYWPQPSGKFDLVPTIPMPTV